MMNNFSALDARNRRNLLAHSMNAFSPPFHKNYSTDTTAEMKTAYDSLFINTVHLIPEPIKMNLADSVMTLEEKPKTNMATETKGFVNMQKPSSRSDYYPSLAGITSFFSGVFNVMGAIFQKRANSPVQYYDCFEQGYEDHHQRTPSSRAWQPAKHEDQNKNGRAEADEFADETYGEFSTDMSEDFKSVAAQCEDKLNRVRLLLSSKTVQRTVRPRRPKRAFHEAGSVEEQFEDAFSPEDFISLANETFLEYCSPYKHHNEEKQEIDSPKVKTEAPVKESMEIVQSLPQNDESISKTLEPSLNNVEESPETKRQVVSSCEDKVSQLKALLKRRPIDIKLDLSMDSVNTDKGAAIAIPEEKNRTEIIFAKEIELPKTPESPNVLDPSSYFDEVTGRFYSSSASSEDSFQIVFSDSPRHNRKRIPSDCESEDSFIVFEESPDSCYTSTDVFGEDDTNVSESEDSESDCESDYDSGVSTITLSHSLSRTFCDLTDGSLYEDSKSEDVVDCAFRSGAEVPADLIDSEKVVTGVSGDSKSGLLLDEAKKREKRKLPAKKVMGRNKSAYQCIKKRKRKNNDALRKATQARLALLAVRKYQSEKKPEEEHELALALATTSDCMHTKYSISDDSMSLESNLQVMGRNKSAYQCIKKRKRKNNDALRKATQARLALLAVRKYQSEKKPEEEHELALAPATTLDCMHTKYSISDDNMSLESNLQVQFSPLPPQVHVLRVWAFAARQARAGPWERHALDRERFKRRIADVEMAVSWVLKPQHRARVMFQRFMPWWNAQKRKELAEQKEKEEKLKQEKEEAERLAAETRLNENNLENKNDQSDSADTKDTESIENNINSDERLKEDTEDQRGPEESIKVDGKEFTEQIENRNVKDTHLEDSSKQAEVSCRVIDSNCTVANSNVKTEHVDLNGRVDSIKVGDAVGDLANTVKECNGLNCNGNINSNALPESSLKNLKVTNDKIKLIKEPDIVVNGDVKINNKVLKNGIKKPEFKIICRQQKQAL